MKVAIIGGGICGLYIGWKLAEAGNDIHIFEKKSSTGESVVCSGLFSSRILDFLPQSEKLIENRIKSAIINFPKKSIKINFSKEFLVMNHGELDKIVADLAIKAGAKIEYRSIINTIPDGFDRIIGCDGPLSFTRKYLQLKDPQFRLGIQGFTESKNSSDVVETWPVKSGFSWKIPRGNSVEYGIIAKPVSAQFILRNFLTKNNLQIKNIQSKLIPLGFELPANPYITLCGDACGLTKPWSGGGVVWGLSCAKMLINSFPDFISYKKTADKFFKKKILLGKMAVKIGYFLGFNLPWLLPKNIKIESDYLL